ncbi:hypothetical protein N7U49_21855 [Streptomyces sp. AD2-2]|nr:hypothetical protein N7U49_21855 [Streptomyces sp. AD2-2]
MANEKWNLETNSALTSEPGSPVALVNPPLTAEEHVAARPADYGASVVPPKPTWYKTADGEDTGAGRVQPREIQLYWRSNIGEIAAHSKMPPLPPLPDQGGYNLGARGLDHIYIAGHRITVVGEGDVIVPGGDTDALITGYWDRTDPVRPQWTRVTPETEYTVTIEAYNHDYVYGPASDELTVTTPAVGYDQQHTTLPPGPVNDLQFGGPLPVITSSGGGAITLRWAKQLNVTKYEIFDNSSRATDVPMDLARPGLNEGDVKLGEVNQPSGAAQTVTFTTPNYTTPDQRLALKVRAVRTDTNGTATGPFSLVLRSQLPRPPPPQARPAHPRSPSPRSSAARSSSPSSRRPSAPSTAPRPTTPSTTAPARSLPSRPLSAPHRTSRCPTRPRRRTRSPWSPATASAPARPPTRSPAPSPPPPPRQRPPAWPSTARQPPPAFPSSGTRSRWTRRSPSTRSTRAQPTRVTSLSPTRAARSPATPPARTTPSP